MRILDNQSSKENLVLLTFIGLEIQYLIKNIWFGKQMIMLLVKNLEFGCAKL